VLSSVTEHPRASLGRVLEDLGSTLLDVLCGDADAPGDVDAIVIHDPADASSWAGRALVLGVGVHTPEQIVALLDELGARDCAGLVLRAPLEVTPEIAQAAGRNDVTVLGLAQGTSWMQLAALLRSVLAHDDFGKTGQETLGGVVSGDLFALANAIAALLDAPVTIEDRRSRVLAFSGRQDEADPSRIGTILNREVSAARTRDLEERGVFRELYRTDQPLFVEPPASGLEGFTMPRVALAVRAGDEILGSIWAAVREPLSPERAQTFRDIGALVALHLLSERAGADVERRLRADLVATALEGGAGAVEAASRLGISHQPVVVLALALDEEAKPATASHAGEVARRRRIADALAMHLTVAAPGSTTALVGDVAYGIVPVSGALADAERSAARLATEFLDRTSRQARAAIGVGTVAADATALPHAREGADRALRVVRSKRTSRRVAAIADVGFDALLIEFGDMMSARGDALGGPVARLTAYDAKHKTNLVDTLRAWLDAFGNVIEASQAMWVHPNTFRYRLRRLVEIGELDLDDADTRLSVMLQLRLLGDDR
jgi:DNA-binding PucR family transcriptional regulator